MMVRGRQEHGPKADIVTWQLLSISRFAWHRNSPRDWTMLSFAAGKTASFAVGGDQFSGCAMGREMELTGVQTRSRGSKKWGATAKGD